MPPVTSAGILLHRRGPDGVEVLLGHMGGPFWARKDAHAWSVPKGEHGPEESPLDAARREFTEEIGAPPPDGEPVDLGTVRQSRKTVAAFALDGSGFTGAEAVAGRPDDGTWVEIEWPPRSGRTVRFPELDRAGWFDLATAREKIVKGQLPFLDRVTSLLG
ncbi:MutT-like protein [Pseudonocardia sp. Ae168_Ps1]|uniref:NUDIX domain-containing protein n=1 Tax=Pseudonocardia sp. Ae150A_Ps1 TaxID=1885028 RepID=UPI00094AE9F5|nr:MULTISPECIES: NUDIX domain-containing protein [unclassified Pseudonocardia]OLL72766.1 MutT-like protein [Pseudonocardia sp. Ae150A_Ps1]OLL78739.1 MutT-like protein [Pseudonocardia sp. Ae168_Ps1]OLL92837.1 MutT-like protein [Pseudonocardia sp. Ae356_Ps1]